MTNSEFRKQMNNKFKEVKKIIKQQGQSADHQRKLEKLKQAKKIFNLALDIVESITIEP